MLRTSSQGIAAPRRDSAVHARRRARAASRGKRPLPILAILAAAVSLLLPGSRGQAAEAPAEPLLEEFSLRVESGEHTGPVTSIATTPRGEYVVTASEDRTARVWDGTSFTLLRTLRPPSQATGAEGRLYAVAISPDGALVATAGVTRFFAAGEGRSSTVYLFDRSSGALVRMLPGSLSGSPQEQVSRLCFARDGQRLLVGHVRSATMVFEVASGRVLAANLEPQRELLDADFDGAGRLLLTLGGGVLRLLDRQLQPLAEVQLGDRRPLRARFSADGTQVAVLHSQGARVELRAGKDLKRRGDLAGSGLDGAAQLTSLVWSADDKSLYAAGRMAPEQPARLWRWPLRPGGPRGELQLAQDAPLELATRPGGGVLFAAAEPSWGAVDGTDQVVQRSGGRHPLAEQPEALLVDASGEQVELPVRRGSSESVRFTVRELRLAPSSSTAPPLRAPRSLLPGHEVTGWRLGGRAQLDGAVLTVPPEQPAALAVAPDARSLVLGTSDRLLRYAVPLDQRADCPLPAGASVLGPCASAAVAGALAVNFSGDGRFVVAALRDGTVRWYGATALTEQLALYLHPDGKRWALWRPDGRFAASVGGDELVGFHVNRPRGQAAELFPLARLRPSRDRPVEVAAALREGPAGAPPVALRQVLPPTVMVTAPGDGAAVSSPQVVLHVVLSLPEGQEPSALRVLIDGRLAAKLSGEGGRERDLTVTVPPRDCTVSVIAQSAAGSSTPASLRLRWTGPPPAPAGAPELQARLLLLAVGVGAYNRPDLRLTYPAKDARDLAALLQRQRPGLYREVQARVLTDGQASRQGILDGIEWLHRTAAVEDTLVLLLAGHGIADAGTGQYYFLPVDADPLRPLATMLPAATLQQALATLPGRVVLLLDTCHAGEVLPGRKLRGLPEAAGGGISRFVSELGSVEQGVVVLTSSIGTQPSQESAEWGNGAFTKALLEGLSGRADYRKTGRVTLNMLDLYLSERVRELTQGTQTPATAKPSTIADFPLVLSP
jgi:WD40 repeat protein